jgi:hypothetical protein
MSEESRLAKSDPPKISDKEQESWALFKKCKEPPIPLKSALNMYELFLNSYDCEEIHRLNGGKFSLGQVVDARIRYEWDKRKELQLQSLYGNIEQKVMQVKNQAVSYVADLLAAAHRLHGDKIKQFIQTGNLEDLGDLKITSIKDYREIINLLAVLTQSAEEAKKASAPVKAVHIEGEVKHVHQVDSKSADDVLNFLERTEINGKGNQ